MTTPIKVRVQADDFDINDEIEWLKTSGGDIGAIVTFTGVCRADKGRLAALELEHYPGMAEIEIGRIARDAAERWPLSGVTVIHRHGKIPAGANIVLVGTASEHRQAAFDAASYLMDFMKSRAPFWKKEHLASGTVADWVEAKPIDTAAAKRWR